MNHDSNPPALDAQSPLTSAQRYVVDVARLTVEVHKGHGAEQVARWIAPPPGTSRVADTADLPGALAIRQIKQLLAIIDTLVAS